MYGALSNFDVVNTTGEPTYGFEIEIHGVTSPGGYFTWNRYGNPIVTPTPDGNGVYVRYMAQWDPAAKQFSTSTISVAKPTATNGHACLLGTLNYDTLGCEHFGVWTYTNPTSTTYRWLLADPNNPGQLIPQQGVVAIPAPTWVVQPPAVFGAPAVVVAQVDPPVPPPPAKLYGEAQWMKTFKTENNRQVGLDELVADNAVVPEDAAHLETAWDLIQADLLPGNGKQKQKRGALGGSSHAVVRRFEFYKFAGTYDPITNQAICLDGTCTAPADSEIGDFIGAQNGAANLNVPDRYNVTVTVVGDGSVSTADRAILCGTVCTEAVLPGTTVTLTAKNGKGIFSGWTGGACAGTSLTCTITVNSEANVSATFRAPVKVVLKVTGSGTITSNPAGTSFLTGDVVTFTATPGTGSTFTGWTTACSGTASTCTLTLTADTTVSATFATSTAGGGTGGTGGGTTTTYKLTTKVNGKGTVSVPSGNSYAAGTVVSITATPAAGAIWNGWTGDCTGLDLTCTVTMNAAKTVQANFR
jgi:hypothetical protein